MFWTAEVKSELAWNIHLTSVSPNNTIANEINGFIITPSLNRDPSPALQAEVDTIHRTFAATYAFFAPYLPDILIYDCNL